MSRLAAGLYIAAMDLAEAVGRGNREEVAGAEKALREQAILFAKSHEDGANDGDKVIKIFFDGNGNKGMTGLAQFRIYWPDGTILPGSVPYEKKTHNELEYQGLIHSLEILLSTAEDPHSQRQKKHGFVMKDTDVVVMGDSKLVIEQVNGRWRVKEKHLVPYRDKSLSLLSSLKLHCKSVELKWIPSSENLVDRHS